ncbi:MAG TPA: hypothetical protein VGA29_00450 [Ignavibacteriaceae bacterium]|jgi:hypothetical protein
MKKFIKSYLTAFIVLIAVIMNGCDIFENFLFNVPISFQFEATDPGLLDAGSACLEDNETYNDVKDDINTITFVKAYIAVLNVNPSNIQGDITLELYGGSDASGTLLAEFSLNDARPSDYLTTNDPFTPLEIDLGPTTVQAINQYLANDNNQRCFFGRFVVTDPQNIGITNNITVRLDVLFSVDADLN